MLNIDVRKLHGGIGTVLLEGTKPAEARGEVFNARASCESALNCPESPVGIVPGPKAQDVGVISALILHIVSILLMFVHSF